MSKILVADEDLDFRNLLKIVLEKNGYQVSLAADGVEAVEKAEKELPDLILLDVVMPAKTGCEVCKILKSQDRTKHIPIIILTILSATLESGRTYLEEAGAEGYLQKPFNEDKLLAEVKKHLEQRKKV